jgi:hypothetical protein
METTPPLMPIRLDFNKCRMHSEDQQQQHPPATKKCSLFPLPPLMPKLSPSDDDSPKERVILDANCSFLVKNTMVFSTPKAKLRPIKRVRHDDKVRRYQQGQRPPLFPAAGPSAEHHQGTGSQVNDPSTSFLLFRKDKAPMMPCLSDTYSPPSSSPRSARSACLLPGRRGHDGRVPLPQTRKLAMRKLRFDQF